MATTSCLAESLTLPISIVYSQRKRKRMVPRTKVGDQPIQEVHCIILIQIPYW